LEDGTAISLFTDTGGGWNVISKELAEKYEWPLYERQAGSSVIYVTDMPKFSANAAIPQAGLNNWWAGQLQVVPQAELSRSGTYDGALGGRWHAEKIIDFNYPSKTISVLQSVPNIEGFSKVPLGFQKNNEGNYTMAFPSINIIIEGQSILICLESFNLDYCENRNVANLNRVCRQEATKVHIIIKWLISHFS
jgi:hypothetical protein